MIHCLVVVSRLAPGIADKRDVGCKLHVQAECITDCIIIIQCIMRNCSSLVRASTKEKDLLVCC